MTVEQVWSYGKDRGFEWYSPITSIVEYQKDKEGSLLIITHNTKILESLHVDYTHVLVDGKIVTTGGAELVEEINNNGFDRFVKGE